MGLDAANPREMSKEDWHCGALRNAGVVGEAGIAW